MNPMSERLPSNGQSEEKEDLTIGYVSKAEVDEGLNLIKSDEADYVRGGIVRYVRSIWDAVAHSEDLNLYSEYVTSLRALGVDSKKYRLYNIAFGSSVLGSVYDFDTEDGKIEAEIRKFANEHNLHGSD